MTEQEQSLPEIHRAALNRDLDAISRLVSEGYSVDGRAPRHQTCLHLDAAKK